MQEYEIKRGHGKSVNLPLMFEAAFESANEGGDGFLCAAFGSMPKIRAKLDGTAKLIVDTETDPTFMERIKGGDQDALQTAQDTQMRWNDFLEGVTGFSAKERGKRAQKKAKEGKM